MILINIPDVLYSMENKKSIIKNNSSLPLLRYIPQSEQWNWGDADGWGVDILFNLIRSLVALTLCYPESF